MEGVCPECASALLPPAAKPPGILRPALAGIGFICVTGAVLYVGLSDFYPAHAIGMAARARPHAAAAYWHKAGGMTPVAARPIMPASLTAPTGLTSGGAANRTR